VAGPWAAGGGGGPVDGEAAGRGGGARWRATPPGAGWRAAAADAGGGWRAADVRVRAETALLQGSQRHHRFHGLPGDSGEVLEVAVVMENCEVCSLGDRRQHQVCSADYPMLPPVGQQQHDLGGTIEVGLVSRHEWKRAHHLLMDVARPSGAEQGFQLEHAASAQPALLLETQEQAGNGGMAEAGVDTVVQQVGQPPYAWLSTSSLVSSTSPC
jgi:hypothetical protein